MKYNGESIAEFLIKNAAGDAISFHMPGHKGTEIYKITGHSDFLRNMVDLDITEIPGADNLFHAEGIIAETAKAYSRIYGVKKSYLLVNGTSCGIVAAILACVGEGERIIMARNCHKSVYTAVRLGKINAEYVYPSLVEGMAGAISPEDIEAAFDRCPDARAVILPSPNYYGICSDIKAIVKIVHDRGRVLIVDQAHGAHLKMMEGVADLPLSAESSGADIIINSTHKTLASFTQSAILNVNSDRVSEEKIEDVLQIIESTSPSYLLMGSLDVNRAIIEEHGDKLFEEWAKRVNRFYDEASRIKGIKVMEDIPLLDKTKLNIDGSQLGISGSRLASMLSDRNIIVELATGSIVMCMTGIGTTDEHIDRLIEAINEISKEAGDAYNNCEEHEKDISEKVWTMKHIAGNCSGETMRVSLENAEGMCAADYVIPYPPGVPLVCRGEIVTKEDCEYVLNLISRGEDVLGVDDCGRIKVYKELK